MRYAIDERMWEGFLQEVLSKDTLGDDSLPRLSRKAHRLMEGMVMCEDPSTLSKSMYALSSFLREVHRRTGVAATPSNFIMIKEDDA